MDTPARPCPKLHLPLPTKGYLGSRETLTVVQFAVKGTDPGEDPHIDPESRLRSVWAGNSGDLGTQSMSEKEVRGLCPWPDKLLAAGGEM